MTDLTGRTPDIVQENIEHLKQLFPEVFEEGRIDFDKLRQVLGDCVDDVAERYNFTWNGKRRALRLAQSPSTGTLRPCKEESREWDGTRNLYIEGDNLEVLKLLQKSYHGKVKMIYIDPPYNTGGDFVYPDDYADNLDNYKRITRQVDEDGKWLGTNKDKDGRYHSNWLNMMYPRLRLARGLLRGDGVIFISIDDNEVENLKKICNELFGEDNFEGHIHWRRRHNQPNDRTKMIGLVGEHILAYAKNSEVLRKTGVGKIDITGDFTNPDDDPRGPWASKPWKVGSDQSGSSYTITTPTGRVYNELWMGEEDTFHALLADNRIIFPRNGDGPPRKKYFQSEREEEGQCATNWWSHETFGHNQGASDTLTSLFGVKNVFSNPKPIELLRGLLQIANTGEDSIVLDFFSGSGTLAHAVMALNAEDGKNRRYIAVQLPENLDANAEHASADAKKTIQQAISFLDSIGKPHLISEIGKERIRRAGDKIRAEADAQNARGKLVENPIQVPDIGFKVFKLDSSNLKRWNTAAVRPDESGNPVFDPEQLELDLLNAVSNYMPGRSELDVVYEIALKMGLDLACPVERHTMAGKNVYAIGFGALMICLDDAITKEVATGMIALKNEMNPEAWKVVFKDNGFASDSDKANICEALKLAGLNEEDLATV